MSSVCELLDCLRDGKPNHCSCARCRWHREEKHTEVFMLMGSRFKLQDTSTLESLLRNSQDIDRTDDRKQTALFYAARFQDKQHVTCLLTYGANPNHVDRSGQTPLFYAARYNEDKGVIHRLIQSRCNPDHQDSAGRCALDYALFYNTLDVVVQLGRAGADLNLVGSHNVQAMVIPNARKRQWLAIKSGFEHIAFSEKVVVQLSEAVVQDTLEGDKQAFSELYNVQRAFAAEHLLFHVGEHGGDDAVDYWYNKLQCGDLPLWIGDREVVLLRLLLPPYVLGYISFRVRSHLVNINQLIVCSKNRQKGLGSQLLAAVQTYVSRLDGYDPQKCVYRLTCYTNNPAFHFYWNHGFRLEGSQLDSCEAALKALSDRGDSVGVLTAIDDESNFGLLKVQCSFTGPLSNSISFLNGSPMKRRDRSRSRSARRNSRNGIKNAKNGITP